MNPLDLWNTLPREIQNFIVSVTANIATPGRPKERADDDERLLNAALRHGLARFASALGDRGRGSVPALMKTPAITTFLLDRISAGVQAGDDERLKEIVYRHRVPLDAATLEGMDLEGALRAFVAGFHLVAAKHPALVPYLNRAGVRKVSVAVEQLDDKLDTMNRRLAEIASMLGGLRTSAAEPPDLDGLRKRYCQHLTDHYEYLSFKGFTEGVLICMRLQEIFTEPGFTRDSEQENEFSSASTDDRASIPAAGLAVVTGGPGTGKSTLLKRLALDAIEAFNREGAAQRDELPVILPLLAYAEARQTRPGAILDFIPRYFAERSVEGLGPLLDHYREQGRILFMFDGLDEVTDEEERRAMVEAVRDCVSADQGRGNRFIVTCRTASYKGGARLDPVSGRRFVHFRVRPFDDDRIRSFLLSWHRWYEREIKHNTRSPEAAAETQRDRMFNVIRSDRNLHDLAANPLMLTILALIEHEQGELPRDRAKLYEKCLDLLTGRWERLRSEHAIKRPRYSLGGRKIDSNTVTQFLGPVAWSMIAKGHEQIAYRDLKDDLAKAFAPRNRGDKGLSRQQADDFIALMRERSGILQEVATGVYGFIMHRTFIEYLAACWLAHFCRDRMQALGADLFKDGWREVLKLTVASLRQREATDLVRAIMKSADERCANLILAGECVLDAGRDAVEDELYDALIAELVATLTGEQPVTARAGAGEILGRLGDPRDLKEFIEIPGGGYPSEQGGQREIKPFAIGKYPVTNSWYAEFVAAGGYERKRYWTPEGREWLQHTGATHPRYWHDREWNCPDAPVVGVCWWEADAFCRWLTMSCNDGRIYRLPSDSQWYAAAAGKEGRKYPWGHEWIDGACNSAEAKLGKTTSAGIFAKGTTPEGVADLVGNVWEWTCTDYHRKEDREDFRFDPKALALFENRQFEEWSKYLDDRKNMLPALRGGSWFFNRDFARCAVRVRDNPINRGNDVGFRCARTRE